MAAWVLESAHKYARASAVLLDANLMAQSEVNAALSMELLIKSLLAVPVDNARKGTVYQQYSTKHLRLRDGHNLYKLYQLVDPDVAKRVGLDSQADVLESKQDVFKSLRYIYEEGAPTGMTNVLLNSVSWLIPQVLVYFIERGDTDKWLLYMKANPERLAIRYA